MSKQPTTEYGMMLLNIPIMAEIKKRMDKLGDLTLR